MGKITLEYLAKIAGYSKTTVSRVLSGKGDKYRISKDAQQLIHSIAEQENFKPKTAAQSLRNKLSCSVALIVPQISNPFFAELASATIAEAQRYDYSVMILDTQESVELEKREVQNAIKRGVDGIILVPCGNTPGYLEEVSRQIPLILTDRYFPSSSTSYVSTNNYDGAYQMMKYLLDLGHRNILCIQGLMASVTSKERVRGCKQAVKDFGEACNLYVKGNAYSVENGYVATRIGITYQPRPTAIFAMSSTILLGSVQALTEQHVRVPDDISLVSFDNNQYMDYLNPPVSRVSQPISLIGQTAMKILYECICSGRKPTSQILMTPTIIRRNSVSLCDVDM